MRTLLRLGLFAGLAFAAVAASAKEPNEFVIHEWGTFSTFSGSDGAYLKFYPNDSDLPDFVYNRHRNVKGGLPDAFVSLETPVMYFYSDRDRTASVHVEFPKGMITDWYPQASRPPMSNVRWDNLKIFGKEHSNATMPAGKGRYFVARETDACLVQTTDQGKLQDEKFLFYRGVADFMMPFKMRALGKGTFAIRNDSDDAIPGLFLVRVENRKVYFKSLGQLSPRDEIQVKESTEASTTEKLGEAVAKLLAEQGLYEKEARAMVKTWSGDWFGEDGTRVIYIVPDALTNRFLPLEVTPRPDKLARVLVGRHDLLTPERERQIDGLVRRLNGASNADSQAASLQLSKMGRYRFAAQTAAAKRIKSRESVRNPQ